jgi:hypothetical protein
VEFDGADVVQVAQQGEQAAAQLVVPDLKREEGGAGRNKIRGNERETG